MNGRTLLPKKFGTSQLGRKYKTRPTSASDGNKSSLSTEQIFAKMKNHRILRKKSVIATGTPAKKSPRKIEGQMLSALDYKAEPALRLGSNTVAVSNDAVDTQNFDSAEVHKKAMENRMLAKVRSMTLHTRAHARTHARTCAILSCFCTRCRLSACLCLKRVC